MDERFTGSESKEERDNVMPNSLRNNSESFEDSMWRKLNMVLDGSPLGDIQREQEQSRGFLLSPNIVRDAQLRRDMELVNRIGNYPTRGIGYQGEGIPVRDTRAVDAITGKPVTDRNHMGSVMDARTARMIVRHSLKKGIDPVIPLTIAWQETGGMPVNPMHLNSIGETIGWEDEDSYIGKSIDFLKNKYREARNAGITDPKLQLQYYNGFGKPEGRYYYGVDISGIKSFRERPLYAERILDLMGVIGKNPELQKIIREEKSK